jgi:hypothetical protein
MNSLADHRHLFDHGLAQPIKCGRHVAPAKDQVWPSLTMKAFEILPMPKSRAASSLRQEAHHDGIIARLRQSLRLHPSPSLGSKCIGNLD